MSEWGKKKSKYEWGEKKQGGKKTSKEE